MRALTAVRVFATNERRFVRTAAWARPTRLIFVCDGNICRSPFAEGVARSMGLSALSMGLAADPGVGADPMALATAAKLGIDLSQHRAATFDPAAVRDGDLVLTFELRQAVEVERRLPVGRRHQVALLGARDGWASWHLHDPYGLGPVYFDRCFRRIQRCLRHWAER
jgi:protein-tyrosine phosphatase